MPRRGVGGRPPRLDKVLAFVKKLAGDVEGLYGEAVRLRGELARIVGEFDGMEVLVAGVVEKKGYPVLRVRRANSDFVEGGVLEAHITRIPEIGDLVVRLVSIRNVYAEWVAASKRLLAVLEETPSVLEEYRRLVSPGIDGRNGGARYHAATYCHS